MKIVVIGGTGLIGSKLVKNLRAAGHEPVVASLDTGVNTMTGEGLSEALAGADVVVDVSNSPSFEDAAVLEFFHTSTRNLLDTEAAVGVRHHVALSVVGTERLSDSGFHEGKARPGEAHHGIGYSVFARARDAILRVRHSHRGRRERRRHGPRAPGADSAMAADDVAAALCTVASSAPLNGMVEVGGPELLRFEDFIRQRLRAADDQRAVVADPEARYFGARLDEHSLVPASGARLGPTRFDVWLGQQTHTS